MLVHVVIALCQASLAWAFAGVAPPDDCKSECDAIESPTDQQTCRLQCDAAEQGRDRSGVTTWKKEERRGGAPPGSAHELEGGTTTTEETIGADGTRRTTTTTTNKRGTSVVRDAPITATGPNGPTSAAARPSNADPPRPRNAEAAGPYLVLAGCQTRCNAESVALRRATCKLVCLDASPGLVKRRRAPRSPTP